MREIDSRQQDSRTSTDRTFGWSKPLQIRGGKDWVGLQVLINGNGVKVHRCDRGLSPQGRCWIRDREDRQWGLLLCCRLLLCFIVATGVIAVGSDDKFIREGTVSD